jgi:F0F1-type ATP synthase epsilon subunit
MELNIVSINKRQQFAVKWVELQTKAGNFIIQLGHRPMVVELQANSQIRFCLDSSKQDKVDITAGMVHITRESITVLIDNQL